VAIRIGGQTYRVRAQASEQELQRLATTVDARLRELSGAAIAGGTQQGLLLVAISLAHELETERAAYKKLQRDTADLLQLVLEHVDRTLATADATIAAAPQPANGSDY
jgi:cell division protein ZapA